MRVGRFFAVVLLLATATSVSAATYYVGPGSGDNALSTSAQMPGMLAYAAANAPSGSTVFLEDGSYDNGPDGYTVAVSRVTFEALHWHGARIVNPAGDKLWEAAKGAVGNVCEGIVYGPCVKPGAGGFSGGGGQGWKYIDCEFTQNDGMNFGDDSLVLHCLFTDGWFNSFDVGSTDFTMRNTIVRRGNRANADSDSVGNKEDLAKNLTFDGLIDYDNEGPGLWFDTNNTDWVVKNSTFFANHGGANWFTLSVIAGQSAMQFQGNGQDGAKVKVGTRLKAVGGTAANLGFETRVSTVSGYNPMTITVSPALPAPPAAGDGIAVWQGGDGNSNGVGLMSEANPNGTFINNVTYNNTDAGFFDADSGDGYGVKTGGVTITGNQFDYDGVSFRALNGGKGDPTRKLGPAIVQYNKFKVGAMTGKYAFHPGGSNGLYGFPVAKYGLNFDYNTYSPDPGYTGPWAAWYIWIGYPTPGWRSIRYTLSSLSDLNDPSTFDQDQHSTAGDVEFRGPTVPAYVWPGSDDTAWSDIYCPNNVYSSEGSIHQVNDDETPYIQSAITGKPAGARVRLTVFGHTAFVGDGPYTCDVYDYSGRYLTLTMKTAADEKSLDAAVPGYAVLTPSVIRVTLTSDPSADPYDLTAVYTAPKGR